MKELDSIVTGFMCGLNSKLQRLTIYEKFKNNNKYYHKIYRVFDHTRRDPQFK
jgi:hypothetical protein